MIYFLLSTGICLSALVLITLWTKNRTFTHLFPFVCDGNNCHKIIFSKDARLIFNIPNAVYGIIFYSFLILFSFLDKYQSILFIPNGIAVIFSSILIYRMFHNHRVFCKVCLLTHGIQFAVFSYYLHHSFL